MSKILFLSASPQRDLVIDTLISEELKTLGHEVHVRPCMREGRKSILEIQPNIVVLPPIKQPYSADFAAAIKRFGCAVVVRHTEASCDWTDYKAMTNMQKNEILGGFPYYCDVELVWGDDEAQILNQRPTQFRAVAVGSFGTDIYFKDDLAARFLNREAFCQKWKLDPSKKTLLITCPWGFADTAPDLHVDEMFKFKADERGMKDHIEMIKFISGALADVGWNVMLTLHPGVVIEPYRQNFPTISIDTESAATELLVNCDSLIHSGSTMAVEMHLLNKPAFMFNDVNIMRSGSWFDAPSTPLSNVSPKFDKVDALAIAIQAATGTNANIDAVKALEAGRYGKMDGLAHKRAAQIINQLKGEFRYVWPRSVNDYSDRDCLRQLETVFFRLQCGICGEVYYKHKDKTGNWCCPWCAARCYETKPT